ncbi:MAG: hypothetical protein ABI054_00635 [Planctomycetota bacterium]
MKHPRKIKLILPRVQLRLIAAFLCLSAIALFMQYMLLMSVLSDTASELPHDGLLMIDGLGEMLGRIFLVSAGVIMPLTLMVGILVTHRLLGPIYRFKVFLKQVADGERPPDCRLRHGDELQDLCDLINRATVPLRQKPNEIVPVRETAKPGLRAAG